MDADTSFAMQEVLHASRTVTKEATCLKPSPASRRQIRWHEYEYSKDFLCAAGFACTGERTLVAVADGLGRYAVKYVYWPLDEMPEMEALAEHVFDSQGAVLCCYCAARGDSPISEREGATRRSAARWSCSDRATARAARPAGAKRDSPVAYNPNH